RLVFRQTDAQVGRLVNGFAVSLQPAVGGAKHETAAHHALEVDAIFEQLYVRANHALELHFAGRERHAAAGLAEPAEEEAGQRPLAGEAWAARYVWIALEVAREVPIVRTDVIFRADVAPVVLAARLGNVSDAMDHQHRRQRKLRIAGSEQLAATAGKDFFVR